MEIRYAGQALSENEKAGIMEILEQCDREFVPPLSGRKSSVQKNLSGGKENAGSGGCPTDYFHEIMKQDFILCTEGGSVLGFMTFRRNYICSELEDFGTSLYITTACVRPGNRNAGLLGRMYDCMEKEAASVLQYKIIATRTWSSNGAHLHVLQKRGYHIVKTLKDDRGPGIDTVYLGKTLSI